MMAGRKKKIYFCKKKNNREFTVAVEVFDSLTLTLSSRKCHSSFFHV